MPKIQRRRFSVEDKQRILAEADQCREQGELGALLRREGLYGSQLSQWGAQREAALREALARRADEVLLTITLALCYFLLSQDQQEAVIAQVGLSSLFGHLATATSSMWRAMT